MANKDIYTAEQVKRVLNGSGLDIEAEYGTDYIVFCPYHSNTRTPAGEVSKDHGTFFCFGCQTTKSLVELIMHVSNRTYFEAVRYIKSKEQETSIEDVVNKALYAKPDFIQYDEVLIKRLNNQTAWSRQIAYDADWVMALGRPTNSDIITCVFRKNRNGFMGEFLVQVDFDKGYYRYKDYEDGK